MSASVGLALISAHAYTISFDAYPEENATNPKSCKSVYPIRGNELTCVLTDEDAINKHSPGDAVIIFTPDSEPMRQLNSCRTRIDTMLRHSPSNCTLCH